MAPPTGISLEQLVSALQRKSIPLPFEMGTFLVLEACERVVQAPALVTADTVWMSPEGEVAVLEAARAESGEDACRALVVLLGDLLVRSAPGVPPMLLQLVEKGPSDGEWSLTRLRDDLEASLVPLNRAATRRVLGRLLREVHREGGDRSAGGLEPDRAALDGELDVLLGVEPGTEPPPPPPEPEPEPELEHAVGNDGAHLPTEPMQRARREPEPPPAPRLSAGELDDFERASEQSGRGGVWLGVGLVVLAAVLLAAYLLLGREQSRAMLGMDPTPGAPPGQAGAAAAGQAPEPTPKRVSPVAATHGQLRVTSAPERAQVLMLVGAGPAKAEQLPIGVAHEFVALADGHAPVRAVVPPDAEWEPAGEGREPRYELAMQLEQLDPEKKRSAARAGELGATKLPAELGAPTGGLGTVRVLTTPPGARVYQLVGFTPDVLIDNLPLDEPVELALYLGGHALQRVNVSREDYEQQGDVMLAKLDIELERR